MDTSGKLTVSSARLHSRYEPEAEAERYVSALNLGGSVDYFILIEPGQGYLISALRKRRHGCKPVVLHADTAFRETECLYPEVPMWFPDSGTGVQEFLEANIPEAAAVRIIEWRPSLNVYGESCLSLFRESGDFIKRQEAGRRTASAFGRRWVRNFFRNLAIMRNAVLYRPMDLPIVITGSGPSLESALPQILAAGDSVFVLAASSSVPALAAGGITPDMVIASDGGAWALLHLYACFRGQNSARPPRLAYSLCAALPSRCSEIPLLPMNDGSLWQSMALKAAGVPSVLVPQRGTVTASALELAMTLGTGGIFLAGMDLSVADIKSHARPYGFDHLFFGSAGRLRPVYSQCFERSGAIRAGGSHDVYAAWFKSRAASWPKRIYAMGGSHAALAGSLPSKPLPAAGKTGASGKAGGHFRAIPLEGAPYDRCRRAAETLAAALDDSRYSAVLAGELAPLLFPSRPEAPAGEIAAALNGMAKRYRGA